MEKAVVAHLNAASALEATRGEAFDNMVVVVQQLAERVKVLEARLEALEDVPPSMGP